MDHRSDLEVGRRAYNRGQWREAFERLSVVERDQPLESNDLEYLATAAYLVGDDRYAMTLWMRLHHQLNDNNQPELAAYWGFWLSLMHLLAGEVSQTTGWLARADRLLKDRDDINGARGYGHVVSGLLNMVKGDTESALADFDHATNIAERFQDPDLLALGLLGQGQVQIKAANIPIGTARLDEAMIGITGGLVSPVLVGIVYCAVILTCQAIFDLHRSQEWTRQLDHWCQAHPDLTPFRGQCLVHRSELLQLQGDWQQALVEAGKARDHLAARSEVVMGRACYQEAELYRLFGDFSRAEQMYREALRYGYEPQPGLSLLWLARGESDSAAKAIQGAMDNAVRIPVPEGGTSRIRLLWPCVEIALAQGDVSAARSFSDELAEIAAINTAPYLMAISAQANGAVLLAEGDPQTAYGQLRQAQDIWQQLDLPYELARLQTLMFQTCEALGDHNTAHMYRDAAIQLFRQLGAKTDLLHIEGIGSTSNAGSGNELTARELEVLVKLAKGSTNQQIAKSLAISEHTVARHVSNIFNKLGVASRTAASAYAYENKLV